MKRFASTLSLGLFVLILALLGGQTATCGQELSAAVAASPVGTAFTYQGLLQSGGTPVDDDCDFEFSLWDASTSGNQVGSLQPALNIPVIGGLFAVQLDFGSGAFAGEARWLQTAVRCPAGGGTYTTLAPRQALNPVPYAMQSQDLRLPFEKVMNSPDTAFNIMNYGDGSAISAYTNGSGGAIDGATDGSGTGVGARSDGTGIALGAWAYGTGRALHVDNYGTNDAAGIFINNPANTANVINASTDGLGAGASIRIDNPLNTQPAIYASTDGSGHAVHVNAYGSGSAVAGWSFGTGAALGATSEGTGDALWLSIDNPDNTGNLINAQTNGLGVGASIRINNTLNTHSALTADTIGSGAAISGRAYGSGRAINGWSWGSGWAGYFQNEGTGGGVSISSAEGTTGLSVVGGSKNAVVATSEGARLLYSEESSAVWFTDYGFGHLTDGRVFITIDSLFAETVNLDEPYHVFVQSYGDAELYVSQRSPEGFEVRLRAGDPEVEFSYRLVATRRGYEGKRLEHAAWADSDPNLYPAQPAAPENGGAE